MSRNNNGVELMSSIQNPILQISSNYISVNNNNNNITGITFHNTIVLNELKKDKKICLKYLGDTSHLNSVLYCLLYIEELKKYFTDKKNINFIGKDIEKTQLSFVIERLFYHFYLEKEKKNIYSPKSILLILDKYNINYKDNIIKIQNECLNGILNNLHKELNRLKNNTENSEYNKTDRNNVINYGKRNFLNTNDSVISDNFNRLDIIEYKCSICECMIYKIDTFNIFNLDLSKILSPINKTKLTIQECIELNFESNTEEELYCNNCHKKCKMKSKSGIYLSPKIFVFVLDRGNANGEQSEVPFYLEEEINLESCIEEKKSPKKYKLIGLVSKNEEKKYVAFCNTFKSGYWCYFNDEKCNFVQQEEMLGKNNNKTFIPYILFYKSF